MLSFLLPWPVMVLGCGPTYLAPEDRGWEDYQPFTGDEVLLRTAASMPDLQLLHHDVALLCPAFGPERALGAGCEAATVAGDTVTSAGIDGLLSAWRFDGQRLLTLDASLVLALDDGAGHRTVLARGALDPRVAGDGRRAVFVQLDGQPDHAELGDEGFLTMVDAETGVLTRITDDPRDTAPWLVPHSDEVLFTSGRTGLASLWITNPGGTPRQLTNVGQTDVTADFVPVPSRELLFVPDRRVAVFSAHYGGTHELWSVDLDTGAARDLGPGRLPVLDAAGDVLAVHDDDPALGLQIVRYDGGAL